MTRRTLRDRNRDAIAPEPEHPVAQPTPEPAAAQAPPKSSSRKPAPAKVPQRPAAAPTARLGIYLTAEEFDNAKAAYLADWSNNGSADTFARWIAATIDIYAAQTTAQRATAEPRGRAAERTGSTRSFSIPTDSVARMRQAITADHEAGRWPSDSAWLTEAIRAAVEAARTQNGGTLPTPPPRLPNRLVR